MDKGRMRDMTIGFVLCLALVVSYKCGAANPSSANASPGAASDYATVGGVDPDGKLAFVVVDQQTGRIVFSERISSSAAGSLIQSGDRYW